jgi:hypothetical protein
LLRPQVKHFRKWLVDEAAVTGDYLLQRVKSAKGPRRRRRPVR